jgi:hemoglobin
MGRLPEAKETQNLYAKSLKVSRKKLFMFLSGWLVGAQVYLSSMVIHVLRHLPFKITSKE